MKGDIALTDVGHAYYVVRFNHLADYEFVLSQGPWLIGDSYLTIRKWVPNFIADQEPIKKLTTWVRIPHLSVEYFDRQVLLKIGAKIGRVIKIDRNTESMDRGQYVRFCVEVDLSKPLLSKFRLNGRIWIVQYEGLRMICFKCGHLGHKEEACPMFKPTKDVGDQGHTSQGGSVKQHQPSSDVGHREDGGKYGQWMLVSRKPRKINSKGKGDQGRKNSPRSGMEQVVGLGSKAQQVVPRSESPAQGSRFDAIGSLKEVSMEVDQAGLARNTTAVQVVHLPQEETV